MAGSSVSPSPFAAGRQSATKLKSGSMGLIPRRGSSGIWPGRDGPWAERSDGSSNRSITHSTQNPSAAGDHAQLGLHPARRPTPSVWAPSALVLTRQHRRTPRASPRRQRWPRRRHSSPRGSSPSHRSRKGHAGRGGRSGRSARRTRSRRISLLVDVPPPDYPPSSDTRWANPIQSRRVHPPPFIGRFSGDEVPRQLRELGQDVRRQVGGRGERDPKRSASTGPLPCVSISFDRIIPPLPAATRADILKSLPPQSVGSP